MASIRKKKEAAKDPIYDRLKETVAAWWERKKHMVSTDAKGWRPKYVLGQFMADLGGRVQHPKLQQVRPRGRAAAAAAAAGSRRAAGRPG